MSEILAHPLVKAAVVAAIIAAATEVKRHLKKASENGDRPVLKIVVRILEDMMANDGQSDKETEG